MKTIRQIARFSAIALSIAPLFAASLADAAVYSNGSKTSNFDVTLTIIADCTIASTGLSFGTTQGVLNTAVSANTALNVTCTNTTPYNVGLSAGTGTNSTVAARVMSGTGGNTGVVAFNLYQASGSTNWGNTQGTDTKSGVGTGAAQVLTVYGVVPAQNTPAPDTYKSTITATVYF